MIGNPQKVIGANDPNGMAVTLGVGDAGEDVKGAHVVVEDEPAALHDDAGAPDAFEGVGVGNGHAVLVDDGKVGGIVALGGDGDLGGEVRAARGLLEVDGFG